MTAAADVTLGSRTTAIASSSTTTPGRVSVVDPAAYANFSGHVGSGMSQPCWIKSMSMTFGPVGTTAGYIVSTDTRLLCGPSAYSPSVSTSSIGAYGSYTMSKTADVTATNSVNIYMDAAAKYVAYGSRRYNADAGRSLMYRSASGTIDGVYLIDSSQSDWAYNTAGNLWATLRFRSVPSAPTSINVTNQTSGGFRVRWRVPTDTGGVGGDLPITGYRIMVRDINTNTYTVKSIGTYGLDGIYYYYDVTGLSTGTNYDVHVAAYNAVSTTLNGGSDAYYWYASSYTGTNATVYSIYPSVSATFYLYRTSSTTLVPRNSAGTVISTITSPAGGGPSSWNVSTVSGPYNYFSGTTPTPGASANSYDLSASPSPAVIISAGHDAGKLNYRLTATNWGSTTSVENVPTTNDSWTPTSANLLTLTATQSTLIGEVELSIRYSATNSSHANNYAKIIDSSGVVVATIEVAAGVTSATHYYTASGYTANSYQTFYVYLYNNSGYYTTSVSAYAGNYESPTGIVNISANTSGVINFTGNVAAPNGSGTTYWSIRKNGSYIHTGSVAAGDTQILGLLGLTDTWAHNAGLLRYELHMSNNSGTDVMDYDPFPTPDGPPLAANLLIYDVAAGYSSGQVDIMFRYSARNAGAGENGNTYIKILRDDYTEVYFGYMDIGTTSGTYFISDTGLTPGQTYSYNVYLYNYAGYYTTSMSAAAGFTPAEVYITASVVGYAIQLSYTVTAPANCGDVTWTITRNDGDEITTGVVPAGTSVTETYLDETGVAGTSYSYTIDGTNLNVDPATDISNTVTAPTIPLDGYSEHIGGSGYSPFTGSQAANTDWTSGVTFNSGHTSGAYDGTSFVTVKPIHVNSASVHFRSGGSGTVQLQMDDTANPVTGRYYQWTSSTNNTPLTKDPDADTDKVLSFTPKNSAGTYLLTFTGDKWYAGFRQISGASVLFYRDSGDSGSSLTADNVIYKDGTNVNGDFPAPNSNIYIDFKWRTVPSAPTSAAADVGASDPTTEIDVTWDVPLSNGGASVTGYRILYRESGGDWASTGKISGSTTSSYTITGLTSGLEYEVVVAAVNSVSDYHNGGTSSYTYDNAGDHTGSNSSILTVTTELSEVPVGTKVAVSVKDVSSVSVASGITTYTTTSAHGFSAKDIVSVVIDEKFLTPTETQPFFDALFFIKSVPSSTTFTVASVEEDGGPYVPDTHGTAIKWKLTGIQTKKAGSWQTSTVVKVYDEAIPEWTDKLPYTPPAP